MANKKPELPYGWVVKQSKSYPDRIYYFNINTGASTWAFPDLLQDYVSGKESAVPPVLTATSLIADAVSPPKPVQPSAHHSETRRLPRANSGHTDSGQKTRTKANVTGSYNKKQSHTQEPQFSPEPLENESEKITRSLPHSSAIVNRRRSLHENFSKACVEQRQNLPENISKTHAYHRPTLPEKFPNACANRRQSLPENSSKAQLKSSTFQNQYSEPPVNQCQSLHNLNKKKIEEYSKAFENTIQALSGVNKAMRYQKQLGSSEAERFKKIDRKQTNTKIPSNPKGLRTDGGHPYVNKSSHNVPGNPSLSKSSDSKLNIAKEKDNSQRDKKKSAKLSPIKFPKGSAAASKQTLLDTKRCEGFPGDSSEKVKGTCGEINTGKRSSENLNETNSSSAHDLRSKLKKRRIEDKDKSGCVAELDKSIASTIKFYSKKLKGTQASSGKDGDPKSQKLGTNIQTPVDKRKVVRSNQSQSTENRSISLQDKKIANFQTNKKNLKSSPKFDLTVNTSTPAKSSCDFKTADQLSDLSADFDRNNNTEFKLFIGDKEKLLSIQSWINSLQEGVGSESPSIDSHSQVNLGVVNDSVDSGYVSISNRPTPTSRRGWPGEVKKPEVASREMVAMEIDECLVPKELPSVAEGKVDVADKEEESMDIDEVLVEVRQQVSSCSNTNIGSFDSFHDTDTSTPLKRSDQTVTVVVDTNILISNLDLLETLKDYQLSGGSGRPCLFIPWIVLRELDALKETVKPGNLDLSLATQTKARRGISFLKNLFSSKHPRIKGQTPKQAEEASHNFKSKCNDDVILQACLQCQKLGSCVVLLTNDNNLINKSLVSGVPAFNAKEIIAGLQTAVKTVSSHSESQVPTSVQCQVPTSVQCHIPTSVQYQTPARVQCEPIVSCKANTVAGQDRQSVQCISSVQSPSGVCNGRKGGYIVGKEVTQSSSKLPQTCLADRILNEEKTSTIETLVDDIYCKMKTVLHEAFGKILELEMQNAYADIWTDIVYRKPPWSLKDILECWKKHWIAVFGLVFTRHLSSNIHQLLVHIFDSKGITVNVVSNICEDSSEILQEAATRNEYGARIVDISKTVITLGDLCNKIRQGKITAASISSLECYLQSQDDQSVLAEGSLKVTDANSATTGRHRLCPTNTSLSAINTLTAHTSSNTFLTGSQGNTHAGSENQTVLQTNSLQTVSSQNVQSGSQINPAVSLHCDQTKINTVAESGSSPELMAGERFSHIWKFIYKYCDDCYRTVSSNACPDVLKNIEPVLKVLVSTSLELRKYYAGLLELPVSDLSNREEEFTALSHICNTFFSQLNVQEDVPVGLITPLQLLILYSKPNYRETLEQFLTQLDEMLKMMYQCLHKLCPDD